MIRGQLKADGIVVAGFHATFLTQAGFELKAEAKLVDTTSGRTCATTTVVSWPPDVIAKVKELTEAMERAIGTVLFTTAPSTWAVEPNRPGLTVPKDPTGLGEFLGDDAPPV
jgi:hypothetical protein